MGGEGERETSLSTTKKGCGVHCQSISEKKRTREGNKKEADSTLRWRRKKGGPVATNRVATKRQLVALEGKNRDEGQCKGPCFPDTTARENTDTAGEKINGLQKVTSTMTNGRGGKGLGVATEKGTYKGWKQKEKGPTFAWGPAPIRLNNGLGNNAVQHGGREDS